MTSTRLPGKVLMDVAGKPMLSQQLNRLKFCKMADEIVVATTTNPSDDSVVDLALREGVSYFRGSEHDVLARYVGAARAARADIVVRITADCPLIDPQITDLVINELVSNSSNCDYASNLLPRTYPQGLDVEALFFDVLLRLDRFALSTFTREHVTPFLYMECPDLFVRRSVVDSENNSDLRWTVDVEEDLQLIRALFAALGSITETAHYRDILSYVRSHPEIISMNDSMRKYYPTLQPA